MMKCTKSFLCSFYIQNAQFLEDCLLLTFFFLSFDSSQSLFQVTDAQFKDALLY